MSAIRPHEMQALEFLAQVGTDEIGVVDSDEKWAAAMVFMGLKDRGYVISEIGTNGPIYRLTRKGKAAVGQPDVTGNVIKILEGLDEAVEWSAGNNRATIIVEGNRHEMTRDEFERFRLGLAVGYRRAARNLADANQKAPTP